MREIEDTLLELTAEVVSAYAANNALPASELPDVIQSVHRTFQGLQNPESSNDAKSAPAVSVKRSVRADAIICLECGTEHKMLKRHLKTSHSLSVAEYRDKWNLKPDYPMVAPNYAQHRSELAKQFGLGRKAK